MNEAIIIGCAGAAIGSVIALAISAWRFSGRVIVVESERDDWQRKAETFAERLRDVEPREARFREAMGYYARPETWEPQVKGAKSPAFHDRGEHARMELSYDERYKAFVDAVSKMPSGDRWRMTGDPGAVMPRDAA